jgi:hypothetical protein
MEERRIVNITRASFLRRGPRVRSRLRRDNRFVPYNHTQILRIELGEALIKPYTLAWFQERYLWTWPKPHAKLVESAQASLWFQPILQNLPLGGQASQVREARQQAEACTAVCWFCLQEELGTIVLQGRDN